VSSNQLNFYELNFLQIILEDDALVLKINNFVDQMITIPKNILHDFFSSETLLDNIKFKFNKDNEYHIYDLLTDIKTSNEVWSKAVEEYMNLMMNKTEFSNLNGFLFFSNFLNQFESFDQSPNKTLEASLNTFSKTVITTSRPILHFKHLK
jgi:hypothetical protein